tara:strand:+ start:310 stop:531 length:222 start_codon:yes stop_codon:yes gene_type:complete
MADTGSGFKLLQDMAKAIGSRSNTMGKDKPELNMLVLSQELAEILRNYRKDRVMIDPDTSVEENVTPDQPRAG